MIGQRFLMGTFYLMEFIITSLAVVATPRQKQTVSLSFDDWN